MKKSILATAVALSAGLFASTAMAVLPPIEMTGSTVNFSGNLIPTACEVNVNSQNMVIDLGTIDKAVINANGGAYYDHPQFTIQLDNCDPAISPLTNVAFTAGVVGSDGMSAINEATDSPSSATLLLMKDSGNLPLDGTINAYNAAGTTPGTMLINVTPRYSSASGLVADATAGNTLYNMTYTVKYD